MDFDVKARDMYRLAKFGFYADVYKSEILDPEAPINASRDKLALLASIHNLSKEVQAMALAFNPATP